MEISMCWTKRQRVANVLPLLHNLKEIEKTLCCSFDGDSDKPSFYLRRKPLPNNARINKAKASSQRALTIPSTLVQSVIILRCRHRPIVRSRELTAVTLKSAHGLPVASVVIAYIRPEGKALLVPQLFLGVFYDLDKK